MTELARLAKVDVSTVSRALADSPRVKAATKERVRKLAAEVGFEADAAARNLKTRSTNTLGVVVPIDPAKGQTISDPFYLEMLGAVTQAAARRDYDMLLTVPQRDESVAERRILRAGKADGIIIIGQAGRAERLNALADATDRVVVWGGRLEDVRYTVIGSDNAEGGRAATRHLLSLGRRRILFIGDAALPEVALRYEGLRAAHEAAGLSHDPGLVLPASFGALTVGAEVEAMARAGASFDAVFAASDVLAIGAMNALAAMGLVVPRDVAVVGYDNVGPAAQANPPLTTVDQGIAIGAEMMVDALLRKIGGERVPSRLTPTTLIVRGSTQ